MLHHHLADGLRRDLALAETFQFAHDLGHHLLDALGLDRALAQRDLHRAHQLVAVERHAAAVALDHDELAQLHALEGGEAEIAGQADAPPADRGRVLGRPRVLHLGVEARAVRTAHGFSFRRAVIAGLWVTHRHPLVDREPRDQPLHLLAHRSLDQRILLDLLLRQHVEHLRDQVADLPELGDAEAARGAGRRAEPDARRDRRLLRIERDAVLVAGDVGAAERQLRDLAGEPLGPQIDQHQMGVGAAGDDVEALRSSAFRPAPWRSPTTFFA